MSSSSGCRYYMTIYYCEEIPQKRGAAEMMPNCVLREASDCKSARTPWVGGEGFPTTFAKEISRQR